MLLNKDCDKGLGHSASGASMIYEVWSSIYRFYKVAARVLWAFHTSKIVVRLRNIRFRDSAGGDLHVWGSPGLGFRDSGFGLLGFRESGFGSLGFRAVFQNSERSGLWAQDPSA